MTDNTVLSPCCGLPLEPDSAGTLWCSCGEDFQPRKVPGHPLFDPEPSAAYLDGLLCDDRGSVGGYTPAQRRELRDAGRRFE